MIALMFQAGASGEIAQERPGLRAPDPFQHLDRAGGSEPTSRKGKRTSQNLENLQQPRPGLSGSIGREQGFDVLLRSPLQKFLRGRLAHGDVLPRKIPEQLLPGRRADRGGRQKPAPEEVDRRLSRSHQSLHRASRLPGILPEKVAPPFVQLLGRKDSRGQSSPDEVPDLRLASRGRY